MTKTNLKVVGIVCGGNFNNTRTKVHFNIIVCYNGYLAMNDRQNKGFAHNILIAFIVGVYCNRGITEQCFGTCGSKL